MNKTKSIRNLHDQLTRIEKTFYSLPNWCTEPFMSQMTKAERIAEQYNNNINMFLGEYDIDDEQEYYRRYDLQLAKSIYTKYRPYTIEYLINCGTI